MIASNNAGFPIVSAAPPQSAGVRLPRLPEPAPPRAFPVIATITPMIGSIVLWAVMRSPYVLVFALLGPLVAVASLGDAALQNRRRAARERERFAAELGQARSAIAEAHGREAAVLLAEHRNARTLAVASRRDPERWRGGGDSFLPVVAGVGRVRSTLEFGGVDSARSGVAAGSQAEEFERELASLRSAAEIVGGAPVVVDARRGIGLCGPPVLAAACARGIVLQLANALTPAGYELVVAGGQDADWLATLPHTVVATPDVRAGASLTVEFRGADSAVLVAVAPTLDAVPRECQLVLQVDDAASARLIPHPGGLTGAVTPELVSLEQARGFAALLSEAAGAAGLGSGSAALPESLPFRTLHPEDSSAGSVRGGTDEPRCSLACTPIGGAAGPVVLDLVADGPHAIVGGTTGSGKSEFLVSWVLAIAARHPPEAVTFLLVDFKGGAAFTDVQRLPHSVGVITDLDERSAHRALTSLRAELRFRERALAEAGVRSIEQLPDQYPLPRLVIVVDEFAAMVQEFPELHELFADLASRGRSLGVHLILCTQRPAGVVRDAVLANCTLRVSLRVNNRADSIAVIGSGAAAELPRHPLGRAFLCVSGGEPQAVQVALARPADCDRIVQDWTGAASGTDAHNPRRPWCDPLPAVVRIEDLERPAAGLVFGLADLPQEQRQPPAVYLPESQGSLLVVGAHGSGKSGMLAALAAAGARKPVEIVPRELEGAWDAVTGRLSAIRAGCAKPGVMLLDDVDALLGSYPEEYAHAFADCLAALLREGGRAGTQLVLTACRLGSGVQPIAALCDSRLVLRLPNRQEHVLAGGESAEFDAKLQPGGGYWRGNRVQVALAEWPPGDPREAAGLHLKGEDRGPDWDRWPGCAVVTTRPREIARLLAAGQKAGTPAIPSGWELVELGALSELHGPAMLLDVPDGPPSGATDGELTIGPGTRGRVVVTDPEAWQSHWRLTGGVKATMPILFDRCSTVEFRAISSLRQLPPPISPASGAVWMLAPDGTVGRVAPPWNESK